MNLKLTNKVSGAKVRPRSKEERLHNDLTAAQSQLAYLCPAIKAEPALDLLADLNRPALGDPGGLGAEPLLSPATGAANSKLHTLESLGPQAQPQLHLQQHWLQPEH